MRAATRKDVAAIVALLADDELGSGREVVSDPPAAGYLAAFDEIAANPRTLLAVAEDTSGAVVGTLELTFIPGLSNQGAEVALVSTESSCFTSDSTISANRQCSLAIPFVLLPKKTAFQ